MPANCGSAVLRRRYDSCEGAVALQCRAISQGGSDSDADGYLDAWATIDCSTALTPTGLGGVADSA